MDVAGTESERYHLIDPERGPRVVLLERFGDRVAVHHGPPDHLEPADERTHESAEQAQRALRRRLKRLWLRGYRLGPENPAMRDAIQDLDDLGGLEVYADWLTEHGHPRGALIRVQIALESDPTLQAEADGVLARHRAWFVPAMQGRGIWKRGFLDHLELDYRAPRWSDWVERNLRTALAAIRRHPSGRFVRYAISPAGIRVE